MIRRFLAGYTAPANPYPPYISINETDKGVSVAIREPARPADDKVPYVHEGRYAGIVLERSIAVKLLREALTRLEAPRSPSE